MTILQFVTLQPCLPFILDNLSAWERYENKRNDLADKLAVGDRELDDIKKVQHKKRSYGCILNHD